MMGMTPDGVLVIGLVLGILVGLVASLAITVAARMGKKD